MNSQSTFKLHGGKQGCPLSPTLFGLYIDKLEEVVNKVVREQGLSAPKLMQVNILLLVYTDDVVLFSYDVDGMQHFLGVLAEFCHNSGLVVNVEKTKTVVQTIQSHHYPKPSNLIIILCSHIEVNIYNLFKSLNIFVLMNLLQINGVHALILGFKLVGNLIIFWRTNAVKVILVDRK